MCGIVGRLGPKYDSFNTQILSHRGPDSNGIYLHEEYQIGLGHTRLAIQDLSDAGHQPMFSNSGRSVIVFNGEIYNHLSLRDELENQKPNHIWTSQSDTETLIEYIEFFGLKSALSAIHGMFAFAYFDTQEKKLYLARDRFGEKPLYYGSFGSKFVFASELKAIQVMKDFQLSINYEAVHQFLSMNFIPTPKTIFAEVSKLPSGSFLTISIDNEELFLTEYWNIETASQAKKVKPFASSEDVFEALKKSARSQLISDVPVGAFLSGGIDSSAVLSAVIKENIEPVTAYTIAFDSKDYNEAYTAEKVATYLGAEHKVLKVNQSDVIQGIEKIVSLYDEPFGDYSQVPTYLLAKFAKKDVTVVLTGDGGDELFQGYNRHIWYAKYKWIYKLPLKLRSLISKIIKENNKLITLLLSKVHSKSISSLQKKMQNLTDAFEAINESEGYKSVLQNKIEGLLNKKVKSQIFEYQKTDHNSKNWALNDIGGYLTDSVLVKVDRATMAHSLEARVPMLDHSFAARAWATPSKMNIRKGMGKALLRDMLASNIGLGIDKLPKQGFTLPLSEWLRSDLADWAADKLSKKNLCRHNIINYEKVVDILSSHNNKSSDNTQLIWNLIVFQCWIEKIDNRIKF